MEPTDDSTTNQGVSTAPTQSQGFHKALYSVVVLVVIVLLGAGWWFFGTSLQRDNSSNTLHGTLYLTLRTNREGFAPSLLSYDLDRSELKLLLSNSRVNVTEHISPDGKKGVFVLLPTKESRANGEVAQIYTIDLETNETRQVTNSDILNKRNPEWSSDGTKVAFMGKAESSEDEQSVVPSGDFSVFVTDLEGNERFVTKGTLPQWTPDGNLVMLKNDGLHLFNLDTLVDTLVWPIQDGGVYTNMKIDVSRDGKMVAWSFPDRGEVVLVKVSSWDPFEGDIVRTIDAHGFWAVFSPDAEYLAIQEVDWENLQSQPNPRLVIYNLTTGESSQVLDLSAYDQKSMFMTDWRY